jgi:hypothetical protein
MISKLLAAIAAVTAVVLAGDKYFLQSGLDLRLSHRRVAAPEGAALGIRTGSGDLICRIRLHVRADAASTGVEARLADGRPLAARAVLEGRRGDWLVDVGVIGADNQPFVQPFTWPVGVELRVIVRDSRQIELTRWEVFDKEGGVDSSRLAARRSAAFWSILVLLCLTAVAAIVGVFQKPGSSNANEALTPEHCIRTMIRSIDGADHERARTFLSRVLLERVGIDEALDALGFDSVPAKRAFFFRTINHFKSRLENFLTAMRAYIGLLQR